MDGGWAVAFRGGTVEIPNRRIDTHPQQPNPSHLIQLILLRFPSCLLTLVVFTLRPLDSCQDENSLAADQVNKEVRLQIDIDTPAVIAILYNQNSCNI